MPPNVSSPAVGAAHGTPPVGRVEDVVGDDTARYAASRSLHRGRPVVVSLVLRWVATPLLAFGLAAPVQQVLLGGPGMRTSSLVILFASLGAVLLSQGSAHST